MVRPYAGLDAYSACKMNGEKYVENHHKIHETVEIWNIGRNETGQNDTESKQMVLEMGKKGVLC